MPTMSPDDAAVVTRLKQAGAIVLAKTNTAEFAAGANTVNRLFGATRNPWNLTLSVGGSSGDGAAALAAGMLPLATDFGGSLRVPAAFCGVVRPTAGLVPRFPTPLPWDVGTVHGPMPRTAEDTALLLEAMIGGDGLTPIASGPPWSKVTTSVAHARDLKDVRIAYTADIVAVGIDPEIANACRTASKRLVDHGARIDEVEFSVADGRDAYLVLRGLTMVTRYLDRLDEIERFEPNLKGNIEAGLKLSILEVAAAERKRAELCFCSRRRRRYHRFPLSRIIQPQSPDAEWPLTSTGSRRPSW